MNKVSFAPQLYIPAGTFDTGFYTEAFGAVELRRWTNDDDSVHVAELSIGDALFHLHEENAERGLHSPGKANGVTAVIGLFVADVDAVMDRAKAAGAVVISPAQDYDYGYWQGEIRDPFGHHWMIEMRTDNQ